MKYIIAFRKTGIICYTSHLDVMKIFKRAFKRADIRLAYSQGFNPHPKMGFAQPLSLGYSGMEEYIEFETKDGSLKENGEEILETLRIMMPPGLELMGITEAGWLKKTLAAETVAAEYKISIPLQSPMKETVAELWGKYMGQDKIPALKKQKKKKEPVEVNIKPKIRELIFFKREGELVIQTILDAGSESNLSPELIIDTVVKCFSLGCERADVEVARKRILFRDGIQLI